MIDLGPDDRSTAASMGGVQAHDPGPTRSMVQWAGSFLENAPAPVAIVRCADYRVVYANPAFQRAHPLPAAPSEPSISNVLGALAAGALETLVDDGAASAPREAIVVRLDGQTDLHCSAWPLADGDGSAPLVVIEMRPDTSAVEVERALHITLAQRLVLTALKDQMLAEASSAAAKVAEAANRAKDVFLTTMSHELRTPLNAIGGYAELIELGLRGPVTTAQREDLGRIQRAQTHLLGLINSVLNFSQLKSGSVRFEMQPVALDSSLDAVLEMLMPQIVRKGLVYVKHSHPSAQGERLKAKADAEKVRQILINLFTNSIKFTATGGTISATCEAQGDRALIHVRDTGRGIPEEELSRIFDPFVQVGRKLNSGDQGVGLGLSISRDLARGMGGELSAQSLLGVGSTLTLTLQRISTDVPPSP